MITIKDNNEDLVKKTFNLTSVFADIKSEHSWTTNEVKTVLMLFEQISKHAIYLPDFSEDTYQEVMDDQILKVPVIYKISTELFKEITGVTTANLSREINKIRKGLSTKAMHLPHPLKKDCLSFDTIGTYIFMNFTFQFCPILFHFVQFLCNFPILYNFQIFIFSILFKASKI